MIDSPLQRAKSQQHSHRDGNFHTQGRAMTISVAMMQQFCRAMREMTHANCFVMRNE
jgi:hypothetical protein